jgi:CRP-like cAMP-binding protein
VTVRNRLLLELDRRAIVDRSELVPIAIGTIIQEVNGDVHDVYFPNTGLASFVAVLEDGSMVEAARVELDGFVGLPLALGANRSTMRVIWQVPRDAYRVDAEAFVQLLAEHRFGHVLGMYVQEVTDQMAQVAACNRRHVILQRAARWLLMTHDRVEGDSFLLTQESSGRCSAWAARRSRSRRSDCSRPGSSPTAAASSASETEKGSRPSRASAIASSPRRSPAVGHRPGR